MQGCWSRRGDSNPRPTVYETVALPLSYAGIGLAPQVSHGRGDPGPPGPGARASYRIGMYRVTLWTADPELPPAITGALAPAGLQLQTAAPSEGSDPDPAAAPDVLLLDWRDGAPAARPPEFEAWPDSLRIALLRPEQLAALDPAHDLEDFITAPLREAELVARIQLVLWRHGRAVARNSLAAGDLVVDLSNYQVFESGKTISLTYKEFELLRFLMTHAQQVFTREVLLNRVWGYNYYGGSRTVDVHIRRIRSKLEASGRRYIETVRNVGYRFSLPLR